MCYLKRVELKPCVIIKGNCLPLKLISTAFAALCRKLAQSVAAWAKGPCLTPLGRVWRRSRCTRRIWIKLAALLQACFYLLSEAEHPIKFSKEEVPLPFHVMTLLARMEQLSFLLEEGRAMQTHPRAMSTPEGRRVPAVMGSTALWGCPAAPSLPSACSTAVFGVPPCFSCEWNPNHQDCRFLWVQPPHPSTATNTSTSGMGQPSTPVASRWTPHRRQCSGCSKAKFSFIRQRLGCNFTPTIGREAIGVPRLGSAAIILPTCSGWCSNQQEFPDLRNRGRHKSEIPATGIWCLQHMLLTCC